MPFGLRNAPATFQRTTGSALLPARSHCRAFMDYGIIWADSKANIVSRTRQALSLFRAAGLRAKLRMCAFHAPEVAYLGYCVGRDGIRTDPAKLQGILDFPVPRTKIDIRAFLGLVRYYREFFPGYSAAALTLTELTRYTASNHHLNGLLPEALRGVHTIRGVLGNASQRTTTASRCT